MLSMPWPDVDLAQSRTLDSGESPSCFFMALHGEFYVFVFARTVELAMAYDDSGFIIWKNISVVCS